MTESAQLIRGGGFEQETSVDIEVDVDAIIQQVAHLPLGIPEIAEEELATLLETVLASGIAADDLYNFLEYVRSPLSFVREAAVRHYCNQAPMLDQDADVHFQQGIDAWQRMVKAYSRCLRASEIGEQNGSPERLATIVHRCLFYQGLTIFEHYRAKRRLPAGLWRQLHGFYAVVEKLGGERLPIRDELFEELRVTDCQAAYVAPLLLDAAKPFGHDGRQLEVISRWSVQWAHLATVMASPADGGQDGFILDLTDDASHQVAERSSHQESHRLLNTANLTAHLHHILDLLERCPPPESFGLTEDNIQWTRPLLAELERAWTPSHDSRRAPRLSQRAALRLSVGFDHIHTLIAGQKLKSQASASSLMVAEHPGEDWFLVEESKTGCRLVNPAPRIHLQVHQLIALYDRGGDSYRLAQVQWLMQDALRGIVTGIAFLPGHPDSVSLRGEIEISGKARFLSRAFLLSGNGEFEGRSLVVPKGVFKSGRLVGITENGDDLLAMKDVVHNGTDFDLVSVR